MIESFFSIAHKATGTYKEKGSKFIAFAHPVIDSEQIKLILTETKKEFYDARHHCFAWIIGNDKSQSKAFDDGEPNHSAGDPILNQIRSRNLTNTLVIVVRYFGGIKLGVGGLTQAYKTAAADALNNAKIIEHQLTKSLTIVYSYADTALIKNLVKEFDLIVDQESFQDKCSLTCQIRISGTERIVSKIETLKLQGHDIQLI